MDWLCVLLCSVAALLRVSGLLEEAVVRVFARQLVRIVLCLGDHKGFQRDSLVFEVFVVKGGPVHYSALMRVGNGQLLARLVT